MVTGEEVGVGVLVGRGTRGGRVRGWHGVGEGMAVSIGSSNSIAFLINGDWKGGDLAPSHKSTRVSPSSFARVL